MRVGSGSTRGIDESVISLRSTNAKIWWILGFILTAVTAVWLVIPWEWSTIDDPGFVIGIQNRLADHGFIGGQVDSFRGMFQADLDWGLFRPSYWAYPGFFYLLPVTLAHLVRLVMLIVAIAGPLIFLRRRGASGITVAASSLILITAASGLVVGLEFTSLQELSGAAFIGLGFMFPRSVARLTLWTIAAWFKAPFAWLLIGYAIPLWRRGHRASALVSAGLGLGTIAIAAAMARNGNYTSRFYRNSIGLIIDAIVNNGPKFFELPTLLVLVAFAWWVLVARPRWRFDSMTIALLIGLLGYSGNLLSWTVSGYYIGPVILMFGILLVSLLGNQEKLSRARLLIALIGPLLIASWITSTSLSTVLTANAAINQARDCLLQLPASPTIVMSGDLTYVATLEGADRLAQIATLADPTWRGGVRFIDAGASKVPAGTTHVMWISAAAPPADQIPQGLVLCSSPLVTLSTLANS